MDTHSLHNCLSHVSCVPGNVWSARDEAVETNKERCYYPYDLCEWVPIFKERIAAFVNIQSLIHLYLMILFMVSYKTWWNGNLQWGFNWKKRCFVNLI